MLAILKKEFWAFVIDKNGVRKPSICYTMARTHYGVMMERQRAHQQNADADIGLIARFFG
eukprot:6994249-Prorocentrum_lima.AAC.1